MSAPEQQTLEQQPLSKMEQRMQEEKEAIGISIVVI
jgi:hypothetical protein